MCASSLRRSATAKSDAVLLTGRIDDRAGVNAADLQSRRCPGAECHPGRPDGSIASPCRPSYDEADAKRHGPAQSVAPSRVAAGDAPTDNASGPKLWADANSSAFYRLDATLQQAPA